MTNDVCHHGRLRRKCDTCDLAEEVKELRAENERLEAALSKAFTVVDDALHGGAHEPKPRLYPPNPHQAGPFNEACGAYHFIGQSRCELLKGHLGDHEANVNSSAPIRWPQSESR